MAYSRLFCGTEITVAVSGGHIYVLNSTCALWNLMNSLQKNIHETCRTGDIISQCSTTQDGFSKETRTEGPIIAVAVNEDYRHLVTVGENKILSLWQLPVLELINER